MKHKHNMIKNLALLCFGVFFAASLLGACKKTTASVTTTFSASHVSPGRAVEGLGAYRIAYYEAIAAEGGIAAGTVQERDRKSVV